LTTSAFTYETTTSRGLDDQGKEASTFVDAMLELHIRLVRHGAAKGSISYPLLSVFLQAGNRF